MGTPDAGAVSSPEASAGATAGPTPPFPGARFHGWRVGPNYALQHIIGQGSYGEVCVCVRPSLSSTGSCQPRC